MKLKNKKAQHEIVGFVLIIIIVTIVGLIFLSLSIGKGDVSKRTSVEISHFLEASMHYTTDCAVSYIPNYETLQDLIKSCYKNNLETCLNDKGVCEALNSSLEKLMLNLDIDEDKPNKAYELNIYYADNSSTTGDVLVKMSDGVFEDCDSVLGSSHAIYVSNINSGNIWVELDLCKG